MPPNKNTPLLRLRDQFHELTERVTLLHGMLTDLSLRLSALESRQVLFVNPPVSFPNYDPLIVTCGTGMSHPRGTLATNKTTESGICPPNKDVFG